MTITIQTSGGFAGLRETIGPLDTETLDAGSKREIEQALAASRFHERTHAGGIGADLIHHDITVVDGGKQHVVRFDDDGGASEAPLRRLIELVRDAKVGGR